MTADADHVLLAHTGGGVVAEELRTIVYMQYLRRSKAGPVAVGDEWSELVSDGCGETTRVTLCVRAAEASGSVRKRRSTTNGSTGETG